MVTLLFHGVPRDVRELVGTERMGYVSSQMHWPEKGFNGHR